MAEGDDPLNQYMNLLKKLQDQLKTAKAFRGQKASALIKRSRRQLEQEFAMIVRCPTNLSCHSETIINLS